MKKLAILAGGGHASDLLGVVEACNRALSNTALPESSQPLYSVVGVFDDNLDPSRFEGRGVELFGAIEKNHANLDAESVRFVSAVGYPASRMKLARIATDLGFEAADPIVHPGAVYLGTNVTLGVGTVVHAGVSISVWASIGEHCYVSHGALIGHDSVIGDGAAIMPGASLSGEVTLGEGVMIGTGAVILEGVQIGDRAQVGANAVVTKDIPQDVTVVGIPARPLG